MITVTWLITCVVAAIPTAMLYWVCRLERVRGYWLGYAQGLHDARAERPQKPAEAAGEGWGDTPPGPPPDRPGKTAQAPDAQSASVSDWDRTDAMWQRYDAFTEEQRSVLGLIEAPSNPSATLYAHGTTTPPSQTPSSKTERPDFLLESFRLWATDELDFSQKDD